jgi:hypothetical protein
MSIGYEPVYPSWVCHECGVKYGAWYKKGEYVGPKGGCSTCHQGTCGVCKKENVTVTEPRDYGHLRTTWRKHQAT